MKKTVAVAMALLLCFCLAAPAFAVETDGTAEPVTDPVTEPTEPITEPVTEPITEPVEPVVEPTELETEPIEPETEPTEPETEPIEPVDEAAEPIDEMAVMSLDEPVYSVNVTWGDMEFSYHAAGTWNPKTLSYESTGGWTPNGSNSVTVENTSNVPVAAAMTVVVNNQYGVDVIISPDSMVLEPAAINYFTVTPTGVPSQTFERQSIGTLSVVIKASDGA